MAVEYSKLNSIVLAQPPHHGRPRALPYIMEDVDNYPQASTTNQRRRPWRLNGHRGVGPKSIEIKRKVMVESHATWQPVGIWRGLDPRVVRDYNEKYNGANLRKIRAVKGVGRPWLTLLPQNDAIS